MSPLIILDRDGVINYDSDRYIKVPEEFHCIPSALLAIQLLTYAGWTIAITTNQSMIARGLSSEQQLYNIHAKLHATVNDMGGRIDKIFYCPHDDEDQCMCRKPQPGLYRQAAAYYQRSLSMVPIVGDRCRDLHPAALVGGRPFLVKACPQISENLIHDLPSGTAIFPDLLHVVAFLLR